MGALVIIESPYAGDVQKNVDYARACMRDSLLRGESPFASHLLYTQEGILDDLNKVEREQGIQTGFDWGSKADYVAVYTDLGISYGMELGIANAAKKGLKIEYRQIRKCEENVSYGE